MARALTVAMRRELEKLSGGKTAGDVLGGRSAAGGWAMTMRALYRRGYVAGGKITAAGLSAIGRTTPGVSGIDVQVSAQGMGERNAD